MSGFYRLIILTVYSIPTAFLTIEARFIPRECFTMEGGDGAAKIDTTRTTNKSVRSTKTWKVSIWPGRKHQP